MLVLLVAACVFVLYKMGDKKGKDPAAGSFSAAGD